MNTIENRFIALVSIVYGVGIAGFMIPSLHSTFLWITPYTILASFIFAWIFHKKWEFKHMTIVSMIGIIGFFIEYAGVKTGSIFGTYTYGKTLGNGFQGVPYLIGINWAALVFFTSSILAGRIQNPYGASIVGASMMTVYDFFLEPVAIKLDFWIWKDGIVPFQNYIAWFIAAFLLQLLLQLSCKPIRNKMAGAMFLIQLSFFLILYVWIQIF